MGVRVYHIVANSGGARVGSPGFEPDFPSPGRFFQPQDAICQRHYDVVVRVDVLSGFCPGGKTPLSDDYSIVLDLYQRCGFHDSSIITETAVSLDGAGGSQATSELLLRLSSRSSEKGPEPPNISAARPAR